MIADWQVNGVVLASMLQVRHPSIFARITEIFVQHRVEVRIFGQARDIWARDFFPVQVGPGEFVQFRYDPDYLKDEPGVRTRPNAAMVPRNLGRCRRADLVVDGGNIVGTESKALLTEKIYRENPGRSRADIRDALQKALQVERLIVIPKEPYDPFGHSDAMIRFIDEDSVLMNDYSRIDPKFGRRLVEVLRRHRLTIETLPYMPERVVTAGVPSATGCYVNYLRTKNVVMVPTFGTKTDQVALRKLEKVFSGLPIVPVPCLDLAREGGILNCISASYRVPSQTDPLLSERKGRMSRRTP